MLIFYKSIVYNKTFFNYSTIIFNFNTYLFSLNFKSIDKRLLYKDLIFFFINFFLLIGIKKLKTTFYPFKVKKKLTLNKSPFVHKKSKDQFEMRVYNLKLSYFFYNKVFFFFLKNYLYNFFKTSSVNCISFIQDLKFNYYL